MAKTEDSLFDEIVETRVAPDGTLEASLRPDAEQEIENAVADMRAANDSVVLRPMAMVALHARLLTP